MWSKGKTFRNKGRTIVAVSISIVLMAVVGYLFLPKLIFLLASPKVAEYNELTLLLNEEQIPNDSNKANWESISEFIFIGGKIAALNQEKNQLTANFQEEYNEFLKEADEIIETYQVADPEFESPDEIEFAKIQQADTTWSEIKEKLMVKIFERNNSAEKPIRLEQDVEKELALMSLEQKVAQLFIFAAPGNSLDSAEQEQLAKIQPGGLIYFSKDIISESQLIELSNDIQATNPYHLVFLATDQEGGLVKRIAWDETGSHKQIAQLNDEAQCTQWKKLSETLSKAGVNWNFGVVADVTADQNSFIYPRVFSGNYQTVANDVEQAVRCQESVLSTLKHWPGHGATSMDTHKQLAKINSNSLDDWLSKDGLPFTRGIDEGADSIMLGHLIIPWLDNTNPASLSAKSIDFLRSQQKFSGMIITDDLNMLTQSGYSQEEAVKKAFLAGNDILLINTNDYATQQKLIDALVLEIRQNNLEDRLDASVSRILTAKQKLINSDPSSVSIFQAFPKQK